MSMTNVKEAKKQLESEIESRLKKFESEYGVIVTNVQGSAKFERDEQNDQVTDWKGRISVRCQF